MVWTKKVLITELVQHTVHYTNKNSQITRSTSGAPYIKLQNVCGGNQYVKRNSKNLITRIIKKFYVKWGIVIALLLQTETFHQNLWEKMRIVIRCDGHGVPEILDAILQVFPLDTYVENPVNLMQLMPDDVGKVETPIWDTYKEIVKKHDDRGEAAIGNIERFAFYDEAKTAYAIIATGESAIYANVMLQKGVVVE